MATTGSDYLIGNNLEVLCELLEKGFLGDDIDFGRKLDSVTDEGEIEDLYELLDGGFLKDDIYRFWSQVRFCNG